MRTVIFGPHGQGRSWMPTEIAECPAAVFTWRGFKPSLAPAVKPLEQMVAANSSTPSQP